ncbi:hypothetical protein V2W45_1504141, partial [Cenococcum geophilum]
SVSANQNQIFASIENFVQNLQSSQKNFTVPEQLEGSFGSTMSPKESPKALERVSTATKMNQNDRFVPISLGNSPVLEMNRNGSLAAISRSIAPLTPLDADCNVSCQCLCHRATFQMFTLLYGLLGILHIERIGQPILSPACNTHTYRKRCTSSTRISYYLPSLKKCFTINLRIRQNESFSFTLSIPRVRPPDDDLFLSIRNGECDYIKTILDEGRASVGDILAPYGLSPLYLAVLYGQMQV